MTSCEENIDPPVDASDQYSTVTVYADFEEELNALYTDKSHKSSDLRILEEPINVNEGSLIENEQYRIRTLMSNRLSEGVSPYAIDVDLEGGVIRIIHDGGTGNDPVLEIDPTWEDPCNNFEERLARAAEGNKFDTNSSWDPVWLPCECEKMYENLGLTAEEFEAVINVHYPRPDNHSYWTNNELSLLDYSYGGAGDLYPLWDVEDKGITECKNKYPDCLDGIEMNAYYRAFYNEVVPTLRPTPDHEVVSVDIIWNGLQDYGDFAANHWQCWVVWGISVSCCDCCC